MANVRGMLARVAKLEAARQAPVSPIVALYGSIDAFGADTEGLDQRDFQQVIAALHRWERDGDYGRWHDRGHRVREQGL